MPSSKSKYCLRVAIDVFLLIAVVTGIFLVKKLWPPFQRGMYCFDGSLTYPFRDSDTISDSILLFYGVAIPFNVMCLVEFLRVRREIIGREFTLFGRKFSSWLWAIYSTVGVFLFGCGCSQLSTDITKYSLGYLRPHFIDVCKPDWTKMNCTDGWPVYVESVPCTTEDLDTLKDARMSFPSGHASFSTFTMLYLVIYLQARLRIRDFKLVKPVLQGFFLLLNLYTCFTRITDYKHHWSDVFGGIVLGGSIAVLVTFFVSDLFVKRTSKMSKDTALTAVMLQEYQPPVEDANTNTNTNAHNP